MNACRHLPLSWQFRFLAMYNHNDDKLHPLANVILLDHPSLFFSVIILQTPKARGKQCNVPKLTVLLSFGKKKW